jgi:hypothetical protein
VTGQVFFFKILMMKIECADIPLMFGSCMFNKRFEKIRSCERYDVTVNNHFDVVQRKNIFVPLCVHIMQLDQLDDGTSIGRSMNPLDA